MDFQTVLIVDDEPEICAQLSLVISRSKRRTLTANNGHEALDLFLEFDPAVIVTDYKMPGMNGLDLLREAKRRNPRVQVILISGNADLSVAVQAIKDHAFDFLAKPLDLMALLGRIDAASLRAREELHEHDTWTGTAITHEHFDAPREASILHIKTDLDDRYRARLAMDFEKFIELGRYAPHVIISCAGARYINNVGLNLLIEMMYKLEERGLKVMLIDLCPQISNYLKTLGYHERFRLAGNLEGALAML